MVGSSLSPMAAGYISTSQGWRWVWWWLVILLGATLVIFILFYEETKYNGYTPSDCLHQQTSKPDCIKYVEAEGNFRDPFAEVVLDTTIPLKSYYSKLQLFSASSAPVGSLIRHLYQPFILFFTFPGVFYMSLVNAAQVTSGIIPITVYSEYMTLPPYNFNPNQIGLLGIPAFIGTLVSALVSGPLSDWMIVRMAKNNNGIYEPEMRLWLILAFTPFWTAGTLLFGIGLDKGMHWSILCVGMGVASFGSTPVMSLSLTYLTDTYTEVRNPCSSRPALTLVAAHQRLPCGGNLCKELAPNDSGIRTHAMDR